MSDASDASDLLSRLNTAKPRFDAQQLRKRAMGGAPLTPEEYAFVRKADPSPINDENVKTIAKEAALALIPGGGIMAGAKLGGKLVSRLVKLRRLKAQSTLDAMDVVAKGGVLDMSRAGAKEAAERTAEHFGREAGDLLRSSNRWHRTGDIAGGIAGGAAGGAAASAGIERATGEDRSVSLDAALGGLGPVVGQVAPMLARGVFRFFSGQPGLIERGVQRVLTAGDPELRRNPFAVDQRLRKAQTTEEAMKRAPGDPFRKEVDALLAKSGKELGVSTDTMHRLRQHEIDLIRAEALAGSQPVSRFDTVAGSGEKVAGMIGGAHASPLMRGAAGGGIGSILLGFDPVVGVIAGLFGGELQRRYGPTLLMNDRFMHWVTGLNPRNVGLWEVGLSLGALQARERGSEAAEAIGEFTQDVIRGTYAFIQATRDAISGDSGAGPLRDRLDALEREAEELGKMLSPIGEAHGATLPVDPSAAHPDADLPPGARRMSPGQGQGFGQELERLRKDFPAEDPDLRDLREMFPAPRKPMQRLKPEEEPKR